MLRFLVHLNNNYNLSVAINDPNIHDEQGFSPGMRKEIFAYILVFVLVNEFSWN